MALLQETRHAVTASEGDVHEIKKKLDEALESGNSALARLKIQVEEASKFAVAP